MLDKDGKALELTDKGGGKYTFVMPAGKVTVKAVFMDDNTMLNFFTDVHAEDYYYDAVLWAAQKSITGGMSDTLFAPNAACTRAQIVTFLWRAAGSPEPKALSSFADVPADAYYAKAVAWAVENGITEGTSDTTFAPGTICTRAQGAALLYRAAGSPAVSGSAAFTDVPADAYYADAAAWAEQKDITDGIGNGLFGPHNNCTRAQIVTFLYRNKQINRWKAAAGVFPCRRLFTDPLRHLTLWSELHSRKTAAIRAGEIGEKCHIFGKSAAMCHNFLFLSNPVDKTR